MLRNRTYRTSPLDTKAIAYTHVLQSQITQLHLKWVELLHGGCSHRHLLPMHRLATKLPLTQLYLLKLGISRSTPFLFLLSNGSIDLALLDQANRIHQLICQ